MPSEVGRCIGVTGNEVDSVGLEDVSLNVVEIATSLVVSRVAEAANPLGSDFGENAATQSSG
jgi:hypothetical protein